LAEEDSGEFRFKEEITQTDLFIIFVYVLLFLRTHLCNQNASCYAYYGNEINEFCLVIRITGFRWYYRL